ncbi:hypothetical protein [Azohydromonas aeria]|nr:hypothetical protein [Azohydromonas aeria]
MKTALGSGTNSARSHPHRSMTAESWEDGGFEEIVADFLDDHCAPPTLPM